MAWKDIHALDEQPNTEFLGGLGMTLIFGH